MELKKPTNGEIVLERLMEEKERDSKDDTITGHDLNYAKHYNDWDKGR